MKVHELIEELGNYDPNQEKDLDVLVLFLNSSSEQKAALFSKLYILCVLVK